MIQSEQAKTVELPPRMPLVAYPSNRADSPLYDARLVNGFAEKHDDEMWVYERPGLLSQSRPPAANATGRGIYNWRGNIYSIFDDKLYKDGVAIAGTVNTTNGSYAWAQCLGATPRLQLGNGVKGYNYDSGAGLVVIGDVDFPAAFVKGWAYLDGTTYVMTGSAHILGDDINDTTSWDPLNDILAQIEPDQGMGLAKQLVYVIGFKEWSTEVFYDAANATGSPLGQVQGAKVDFGLAHADSIQDVSGTLCWLTKSREAGFQVAAMVKVKADIISTPAVERLLRGSTLAGVYSWQMKVGGHRFYVITLTDKNITLVYDLLEKHWYQWTDKDGNYMPICASTFDASQRTLLQHMTNGRIYLADMAYADDDGDLIQVDVYTPNFDSGTRRRKQMTMLRLIADQQPGSIIQVRTNDSDYDAKRWTNFRRMDMSRKNPELPDCGTFVRRVHNFRHRCPVRMPRIVAAEVQLDLGTL